MGRPLEALAAAAIGSVCAYCLTRAYYLRRQRELAMINTLHSLHPGLLAVSAPRMPLDRRKSTVFVSPDGFTRVVRVVLTGGPCGGKSSSLSNLMRAATKAGYDVLVVPETATMLFNGGVQFPSTVDDQVNFQAQLMRMQLAAERAFTAIAERTGRATILVMDRGLLDGKGYLPSLEMWTKILERHNVDEEYLLGRYDAIIHLVSSADGAEQFYKSGNVTDDEGRAVFRRETLEEARALDCKMRECWAAHPEQHIIDNRHENFHAKMQAATAAVMQVALKLQPPGSPEHRPRTIPPSPLHNDDFPGVPRRV